MTQNILQLFTGRRLIAYRLIWKAVEYVAPKIVSFISEHFPRSGQKRVGSKLNHPVLNQPHRNRRVRNAENLIRG